MLLHEMLQAVTPGAAQENLALAMSSFSLSRFFLLVAAGGALCWLIVFTYRLAQSQAAWREYVLPPTLLAFAGFVPLGVTLVSYGRANYTGSDATSLNWRIGALYLAAVAVLLAVPPRRATRTPTGGAMLALLAGYWLLGGVADFVGGIGFGRSSFFAVPVLLFAAWRLRPRYEDALGVLTYVAMAACAASLVLAAIDPSVAFTDPARSDPFFPHRLAGIFEQANATGLFASVGLILALRSKNWLRLVGVPVCGIALIASDSRTAWFGAGAAVCVLIAGRVASDQREGDHPRNGASTYLRVLLAGGLIILVALGILSYVVPTGQVNGFTGRTAVWHFVMQHWGSAPVIGHGPQVWPSLIAAGAVPSWVGQAHDQFFQTLFTTGVAGEVLLAGIFVVWTRNALRAARAGFWLPLALEALIVAYSMLESPLAPWPIGGTIWLLSLVLFLDPVADGPQTVSEREASRNMAGEARKLRPSLAER